jgi:hypothetical protein
MGSQDDDRRCVVITFKCAYSTWGVSRSPRQGWRLENPKDSRYHRKLHRPTSPTKIFYHDNLRNEVQSTTYGASHVSVRLGHVCGHGRLPNETTAGASSVPQATSTNAHRGKNLECWHPCLTYTMFFCCAGKQNPCKRALQVV